MNIKLKANNVDINFEIDTGFKGECLLSEEMFNKLPGRELEGPVVVLADGRGYYTKEKLVEISYSDKRIYVRCYSTPLINKNLIGEKVLEKLGIVINLQGE